MRNSRASKTLRLGAVFGVCAALAVFGLPSAAAAPDPPGSADPAAPAVPGEVIVGFKKGVDKNEKDAALVRVSATKKVKFDKIDAVLATVPPSDVPAIIKRLESDPRVEYAEPNFVVTADNHPVGSNSPNDPSFHELWGLHNFGQSVNGVTGTADADIDALEAWSVTKGSASVVVGIIDTGVDFGHPDLGSTTWINAGEDCTGCRTDGVDNDANGYVDDWRGWDFVNNDNNPFDDNGHGTHVAGTIGATGNNSVGVAGVNWTTKIMALKFLGSGGSGSTANAIRAVDYASAMGADLTNNSWGGGGYSQALFDAIAVADAADSLMIAAAGNDGTNNDTSPHYPSSYELPNVISVASTTSSDQRSSFSNYGKLSVDLGAPGSNIYSTYPGNTYRYLNGTSMATPHVAGVAALAKAAFPGASDLGLKALLLRTVDPNTSLATGGSTPVASGGRLNAYSAVSCSNDAKLWVDSPQAGFVGGVGEPVDIRVLASNCASTSGVTVTADANGSPVTLTPRGDGLYEASYTPLASGPLSITATATVGGDVDSATRSGNVLANYRIEEEAPSWVDVSGGTSTGIASDDTSATVSLPFGFEMYDQAFTSVNVSSNGYLVFGSSSATAYANVAIPNTGAPDMFVAPFWDDLNPAAGGTIRYRTVGSAPNRRFVVGWLGVPHYSGGNGLTFEVVLEETTNDIVLQYADTSGGNSSVDHGASATVGVEDAAGTLGRQFSYNQGVLAPYQNTTALRFTMNEPAGPSGPTVDTTALPDGTTDAAYSEALQASGGTPPYSWSVSSGSLPPGLSLNATTGEIAGIPTTAGTYTFEARVSDSASPALTGARVLSITVADPVTITTSSLPGATAGQSYSQALQASGGETPYSWALAGGSLPPGLSLNASGQISGTPSSSGLYNFTVQVTDAGSPARSDTQALSIDVAPAPVQVSTTSLPEGRRNRAYSATLAATGGTTPYAWSIVSGSLPPGLSLNASTGGISGTPSKKGTYSFVVRVTDASLATATKSLSIRIR